LFEIVTSLIFISSHRSLAVVIDWYIARTAASDAAAFVFPSLATTPHWDATTMTFTCTQKAN